MEKSFIISILNKKGGVGKTPIAYALARELETYLATNEASIIEAFYKDYMIIAPADKLPIVENQKMIYDFGGFVSSGVLRIVEKSNLVLVPTNNEYDALKKTIETINEIEKINQNIIIVATRTEGKDYEEIKKNLDFSYPILELKKTKLFSYLTASGKSIDDIYSENALNKSVYASILSQWNDLLSHITEYIK